MKYFILLCDGMADMPVPELDMKTPLECAFKPNMDALAQAGNVGMMNPRLKDAKAGAKWAIFACLAMTRANILRGVPPLKRRL